MPIKKRQRPRRIKPKPKSKHVKLCEDLSNRLQQPGRAYDVFEEIADVANLSLQDARDMPIVALELMQRFDTELSTIQINYPNHVSYRAYITWTDYDSKPELGYRYRRLSAVRSSPSMALSVILAYLQISKYAGRFL